MTSTKPCVAWSTAGSAASWHADDSGKSGHKPQVWAGARLSARSLPLWTGATDPQPGNISPWHTRCARGGGRHRGARAGVLRSRIGGTDGSAGECRHRSDGRCCRRRRAVARRLRDHRRPGGLRPAWRHARRAGQRPRFRRHRRRQRRPRGDLAAQRGRPPTGHRRRRRGRRLRRAVRRRRVARRDGVPRRPSAARSGSPVLCRLAPSSPSACRCPATSCPTGRSSPRTPPSPAAGTPPPRHCARCFASFTRRRCVPTPTRPSR